MLSLLYPEVKAKWNQVSHLFWRSKLTKSEVTKEFMLFTDLMLVLQNISTVKGDCYISFMNTEVS